MRKTAGQFEETVGRAFKDKQTTGHGLYDQAAGAAQNAYGQAKDMVSQASDNLSQTASNASLEASPKLRRFMGRANANVASRWLIARALSA